jgi:hypothetical protein
MVKALTDRVAALVAMRRLPKGLDAAQLETAKSEAADLAQLWMSASGAFAGGDVASAVAKANEVKAKGDELARIIGGTK